MPTYLIEVYVSQSHARAFGDGGSRVRAAAAQLAREQVAIQHLRTTFLPGDETCFHLVEASSAKAVAELCRRLDLGRVRVVEAVES